MERKNKRAKEIDRATCEKVRQLQRETEGERAGEKVVQTNIPKISERFQLPMDFSPGVGKHS